MPTFADYALAASVRDVMERLVTETVERVRPPYKYGTVQSIDRTNRKATVRFPGDTVDVTVGMGAIQPNAVGQTVRVDGLYGDRWVQDVLGSPYVALGDFTSQPAGNSNPILATTANNGAVEIGKYLDFHQSGNALEATDYEMRLEAENQALWVRGRGDTYVIRLGEIYGNKGLYSPSGTLQIDCGSGGLAFKAANSTMMEFADSWTKQYRGMAMYDNQIRFRAYNDGTHYIQWMGGPDRLELSTYATHRFYNAWGVLANFVTNEGLYLDQGWFRTYGDRGLYNQTHGDGWEFVGSNWIRSYNDSGIIIRKNSQGNAWDWKGVRAEANDAWHAGFACHSPGYWAESYTLNRDDACTYITRSNGAWQVVYADHSDQSTEASKYALADVSRSEVRQKIKKLKPKRYRRHPADPTQKARFEEEWAKTKAKVPRRKLYKTVAGKQLSEDEGRRRMAAQRSARALVALSGGPVRSLPVEEEVIEYEDQHDHRWDKLSDAVVAEANRQRDAESLGFTAEEMHEIFPEAVTYDLQGKPQGIRYRMLTVPLIAMIQELDDEIEAIKARLPGPPTPPPVPTKP